MLLFGGMSDDRPVWPTGWPNGKLTWDASTRGVHLTEVHLTTGLYDQCSHTHDHQMSLHGGWVSLTFCVLGSQPASQLASCNWPGNQPCNKILIWQALGWSDMWWQEDWEPDHIGPQSRVPALPLVPLGEWPTWPKPGKWHKWALQPVIYLWYYTEQLFAVLYLCHLIAYSCIHCREMLYGLCSLLTNLHISFHHQSDVLLQQGTTFMKLLFSPEIRNATE